jgi:hypothetical protein
MPITWAKLSALGRELPEVTEDIWYRTPALKVRGKGFTRLDEDGEWVVFFVESVDEQQFLIEARPAVYFITDHYRGYPIVLARLRALSASEASIRLEEAWRQKAPKSLLQPITPKAPRSRSRGASRSTR